MRTPSPSTTSWPTTTSRTWSAPAPTSSASTRQASRRSSRPTRPTPAPRPRRASRSSSSTSRDPAPLKTAVEGGQVDIAWRTLEPDRPQLHRGGRQGRGHPGQGLGVPLLGVAAVHRRGQGQGDPPGRRTDHRPPGHRRQRLRRHRHPVVLHRAPRLRGPEGLLPGEVRRAQRRRGQADPRRGGREDPGQDQARLPAGALRPERRRRGDRAGRPAELQRPVRGHDRGRGVGGVPDALQGGRLRPLHPRLVPRLPGRRQLPVAVHP